MFSIIMFTTIMLAGGPGSLTSTPSEAHCLEITGASPDGGWVQVRNTCREALRGELEADFGYCALDVGYFSAGGAMIEPDECATMWLAEGDSVIGELCALGIQVQFNGDPGDLLLIGDEDVCLDGYTAEDIDAPEPWKGEAVYHIEGVWYRAVDVGPLDC